MFIAKKTSESNEELLEQYIKSTDLKIKKQLKDQLVNNNIGLVISLTKKYTRIHQEIKNDIIQEGTLGLIKAIEKFNPEKNVKLSHYAGLWIKAYVFRYIIQTTFPLRIDSGAHFRKLLFTGKKHNINEMTDEEICKEIKVTQKNLDDFRFIAANSSPTDICGINSRGRSLNESIEDTSSINFELNEDVMKRYNKVMSIAETLDEKEKELFNKFFVAGKSLSEIGKDLNVSKQRAHELKDRIKTKILKRIKYA